MKMLHASLKIMQKDFKSANKLRSVGKSVLSMMMQRRQQLSVMIKIFHSNVNSRCREDNMLIKCSSVSREDKNPKENFV